jgi:predicted nucleotidyltransferase
MRPAISDEIIVMEIQKAVEFLSHWRGVRRIWLFGSAAKGRRLDWRSDLDFAVEGMAPSDRYRAWAELDEQMRIDVDLVILETANAVLRCEILGSGTLLYEA